MAHNTADNDDVVAAQIGRVLGRRRDKDNATTPDAETTTTTNVRSGQARVGVQIDTVAGDLTIRTRRTRERTHPMTATSRIQRQAQLQQRDRGNQQETERLRAGYRAGAIRQDLRRTSQTQQQTRRG